MKEQACLRAPPVSKAAGYGALRCPDTLDGKMKTFSSYS